VLFCDLVGFTARSDQADPEDVGAMLRPYHLRLRTEVGRFGGTLDKLIGDAVMAVFGAPAAHEDDPERALHTALRMLDAIDELNEADPTLQLAVRIGAATGEALVNLDPAAATEGVVGDVVNLAARLQGVAPVGAALVEGATFQATRTLFDFEELAPVRVKGKADPVAVWRLLAARSRPGVDVVRRPATPFVGRGHELDLLQRLFWRALHEHAPQLVTVIGEPGVGKSRLVGELGAFLDARPELVTWRQGHCLPYGDGVTFWALGEVVKAQAGVRDSDDPATVAGKLVAAVSTLFDDPAEREWMRARLAPLLGLADAEAADVEQSESFSAWRQFLEAVAATRPLVLVVEDLHWADPALLRFLEHLVDWAAGVDLLVVTTARPELLERHPGWGGGLRNAISVSLGPLADEETAQLLSALLGRAVLSAETQALLLERAGGNPLYAEELVRLLTDRRLLLDGRLAADAAELPLPGTLQSIIAARLDTLPPARKSLLQDAAVIGKVFWSGALAAMGGVDEAAVRSDLHELQRKELIRAARVSSVEQQTEYAFWHALVRDVAYAQIPRAARARRHRAAAAWMQAMAGDRVADQAELLAHHYMQALALTRALRGSPAEVVEMETAARRFLALAGNRAARLDPALARGFYERALELCPVDHPERPRLLLKVADAARQAGDLQQARSGLEAAVSALWQAGDRVGAGEAMVALSGLLWNLGDAAASRDRIEEAIRLLEGESAGPQLVDAYAELAAHRVDDGQFEEAVTLAERALAMAGPAEQRLRPLGFRGAARCSLGDPGGLDDLRAALREALEGGLTYAGALWYANLANSLGDFDPTTSLATFQEGIGLAERRGLTEMAMWMRAGALERRYEVGRWDELLRDANEVVAWYRVHGPGSFIVAAAEVQTARVLAARGQLAKADELVERCLAVADAAYVERLMTLTVAAVVKQARDQPAAVTRLVEEFQRVAAGRPQWGRARHLPDLLRVCAAAGRLDLAAGLLTGLPSAESADGPERRSLLTAEAVVAEARDDAGVAAERYALAAAVWAESGYPLEYGHALLGWGRCLQRLRRPDAEPKLRQARARFAELGCRPLLAATDAWLQRARAAGS
jgi:class 3 adenylate cyclase